MKDTLSEISNLGMENWFKENLVSAFTSAFGLNLTLDNPILGLGLHSVYDPNFKRIILTKRDLKGTDYFNGLEAISLNLYIEIIPYIENELPTQINHLRFNPNINMFEHVYISGFTGWPPEAIYAWRSIDWSNTLYFRKSPETSWTISYYPELGVWGSFHDYVPYIYFNTSSSFYSLTDQYPRPAWSPGTTIANHRGTTYGNVGIWKHNSSTKGILYQENVATKYTNTDWLTSVNYYSFEFEFIHNETKSIDSLISNFNYTLETFNSANISVLEHGFTHYVLYNTMQISGVGYNWQDLEGNAQTDSNATALTATDVNKLEYLINTRRVGNNWKVNSFRDMAVLAVNTSSYYTATGTNIIGGTNTGTITTSSTDNMFIVEGMNEIVNASYIDLAKNWDKKRKFMDKWVGIRLIYDNITNNLLNLYSTEVGTRQIHR
tara:strand:- start:586 stop:1890 length:1305 start_codon:yes stop_codon:yes gene_type:complete